MKCVERSPTKDELLGLDLVAALKKHGVTGGAKPLSHYINTVRSFTPSNSDSEDRIAYKSLRREMLQEKQELISKQLKLEKDQLELKSMLLSKSLSVEIHKKRLTKQDQHVRDELKVEIQRLDKIIAEKDQEIKQL